MKRFGQLWTKDGATHMLCLRTIKTNRHWDNIVKLIQNQYKVAAA